MITVSITVFIKDDQVNFAKGIMSSFRKKALSEPGCLSYELLQVQEEVGIFTFVEKWNSMENFKAHCSQPYIRDFEKQFDQIQKRPNEVLFYDLIE